MTDRALYIPGPAHGAQIRKDRGQNGEEKWTLVLVRDLRHPPEMLTYLGERNVASFSTDVDSWDFKIKKPEELTKSLMGKLRKAGKGIVLMHDFQKVTSIALPQILEQLHQEGFKVVHIVPKEMLTTLPQYDEAVLKENKLPTLMSRPSASVVRTIPQ